MNNEAYKAESLQENDYNWEEDPNLSFDDKIAILEGEIDLNRKSIKASRKDALYSERLWVA